MSTYRVILHHADAVRTARATMNGVLDAIALEIPRGSRLTPGAMGILDPVRFMRNVGADLAHEDPAIVERGQKNLRDALRFIGGSTGTVSITAYEAQAGVEG